MLVSIVFLGLPLSASEQTIPTLNALPLISGNTLIAVVNPNFKGENGSLGSLWTKGDVRDLVGKNTLISCLIKYESNWNINAVGDNGKARNVLQFWEGTFNTFKKKYNLEYLEWNNAEDQILLAQKMLEDDINNLRHWSVAPKCL